MKKAIIHLLFIICFTLTVNAQNNTIAKFKYEEAEQAYLKQDYSTTINKLEEAEKLFGSVNPPMLYLRIMAQYQMLDSNPHKQPELLLSLKKNCEKYLKDYENLDLGDKYREVYQVSDYLSIYSDNLDFHYARTAYYADPPDYEKALALCKKAIASGDDHAMNLMGVMYLDGNAVAKDEQIAFEWYHKAADKGNVFSLTNLGVDSEFGSYGPKNIDKAFNFYQQAAIKGYPLAMRLIGSLYSDGKGVTQDNKEAMSWFLKAADKKEESAMHKIGVMYEKGEGVTKNYSEALKWYYKGADQGFSASIFEIGQYYYYGLEVEKNYTEAINWYKKAANSGNRDAYYKLGTLYKDGVGVEKDYNEAFLWFKKAADRELGRAMYEIGRLYFFDLLSGKPQGDEAQLISLLLGDSTNNMSFMLNQGTKESYAEALNWFEKAVARNNVDSFYLLGIMYSNGFGTNQDYAEAMSWFIKSADENNFEAMNRIAEFYKDGLGVEKDKKTAKAWFSKAEITKQAQSK